jgi:hypothetical protein
MELFKYQLMLRTDPSFECILWSYLWSSCICVKLYIYIYKNIYESIYNCSLTVTLKSSKSCSIIYRGKMFVWLMNTCIWTLTIAFTLLMCHSPWPSTQCCVAHRQRQIWGQELYFNPFPCNNLIEAKKISTYLLENFESRLTTNSILPNDHHKSSLLAACLYNLCIIVSVLWDCYRHNDLRMCSHQQQPLCYVSLAVCCMQQITPLLI